MARQQGILIVMRHGQTAYNVARRMTGHTDVPLLPAGIAQARETGRHMAGIVFHHVYASPLSRAFNTASLALAATGSNAHLQKHDKTFTVTVAPELIDGNPGDFTGRHSRDDKDVLAWRATRHFARRMPNGESEKDVAQRITAFYNREVLPRLKRGETVLVVAHAIVVSCFDYATGVRTMPQDHEKPAYTSVLNARPVVYAYAGGIIRKHDAIPPSSVNGLHK